MSQPASRYLLFRFSRRMLWFMFKLFHRWEVHGEEYIPVTGGCLLAANHVSYLDPPAMGCAAIKRVVRFMARDTLFKEGFGNWFMSGVAAIAISRERGDVGALKKCIQVLRQGDCVGIFPEGTRSRDGQMKPAKAGIGFLIMAAAVPVVPMYIDGTFEALPRGASWPRPRKVRVFIGPPIQPDELLKFGKGRESYELASRTIMERIGLLKPAPYKALPPA